MLKEISNEDLTNEEKDARGQIWASDKGLTYWFDTLDDVLDWMAEHDKESFEAILARRARRIKING